MWQQFDSSARAAVSLSVASRSWVLACLFLVLYGCSSSGPTRPEQQSEAAGVESEPRQTRAQRRRAARSREEETAGEEGDLREPVPAPVTQAYDRALAAMLGNDAAEAELELEQFVLEYPEYPGPFVNLALIYQRDGRLSDAREALDSALAIDPDHAIANNQLGILNRTEGQFAAAEEAYLRALAADPNYVLAYYNLGVLLDLYLKRPAEALENYERYQEFQAEPNETVARWIIDLRRRVGASNNTAQVAQEDPS